MGKKTRTRRTKWRRLSIGEASGPEEDDDEPQVVASDEVFSDEANESLNEMPTTGEDNYRAGSSAWKFAQNNANSQYHKGHGRSSSPCDAASHKSQSHYAAHYGGHAAATAAASFNGHIAYANVTQKQPFRRGPRQGNYSNGPHYGRAHSWTNGSHSSSSSSHNGDQPKSHAVEKKIFNDEEYTKISTPRQEVLFKKGSIGKKKSNVPVTGTVADNEDNINGNSTSICPPASPTGDGDSLQQNGTDSASTGDASSTTGEIQGPDATPQTYDGIPLVCYQMYDYYSGYGTLYPGVGGILLHQPYPGAPLVAAIPVPVPVQPLDWYNVRPPGDVGVYYAVAYPPDQNAAAENSRRNSVESFQACHSQEMTSETSMSNLTSMANSENCSPCSTGPSSQGPASPQGELASPGIETSLAKGACDSPDNYKMATVAPSVTGYVYATYTNPPAVYAAGY